MLHKELPAGQARFKMDGRDDGTFTGYASVWNSVDSDKAMVRTESGGNRAVSPEFVITRLIFYPTRVES